MELSQYTEAQSEKYHFHSGTGDLDAFLRKFKPSVIETRDSPWICVTSIRTAANENEAVIVSQGFGILTDLVARLKEIEADDGIPTRAKKGVDSKKVVRERAQAATTAALKALSLEKDFTHGKWLLYPSHESVDAVWARVAKSVDHGPLRKAGATGAKVATAENAEQSHVICVYYDNVYDKEKTEKILTALLNHGLEPSAVKSDLYTLIGLDSKHPAKLRSSVWRPVDFLSKDDIKALKEEWSKEKEEAFYEGSGELELIDHNLTTGKRIDPGENAASSSKINAEFVWIILTICPHISGGSRPLAREARLSHTQIFRYSLRAAMLLTQAKRALPATAEPPPKRIKSKARAFRENDIFAGSSDDEDE